MAKSNLCYCCTILAIATTAVGLQPGDTCVFDPNTKPCPTGTECFPVAYSTPTCTATATSLCYLCDCVTPDTLNTKMKTCFAPQNGKCDSGQNCAAGSTCGATTKVCECDAPTTYDTATKSCRVVEAKPGSDCSNGQACPTGTTCNQNGFFCDCNKPTVLDATAGTCTALPGGECSATLLCIAGTECTGGVCACSPPSTLDNVTQTCVTAVAKPMENCTIALCPDTTFCNASKICDCNAGLGYDATTQTCKTLKYPGETCILSQGHICVPGATCQTGPPPDNQPECLCDAPLVTDPITRSCIGDGVFGDCAASSGKSCYMGYVCVLGLCECQPPNNYNVGNFTCYAKIDSPCNTSQPYTGPVCPENAACGAGVNTCQCNEGYTATADNKKCAVTTTTTTTGPVTNATTAAANATTAAGTTTAAANTTTAAANTTTTVTTTTTTTGYVDPCTQLKGSPARFFTIDNTCYYVPKETTDAVNATWYCRQYHDEGEMANLINAKVTSIKRQLAASTYFLDLWLERVPTWQWRLNGSAQPLAEMVIDGLAAPQACAAIQGNVSGVAPFVDFDCNAATRILCMIRSTASCGNITWLKQPSETYQISNTCFFSPPTSLPFSGVRAECISYYAGAQLAVIDGTDYVYAENVRPSLLAGVIYYVDLLQSHWRWMPTDVPQDPSVITQTLGSYMCADITGGTAVVASYSDTDCYTPAALVLCRAAFAGAQCTNGSNYNKVPQSMFAVNDTCFFVPRESVTWMLANQTCAQYSNGAVAAYLNDQNVTAVRQSLTAGVRYHVSLCQSTSNWFWTHTLDNLVEYPHEHLNEPSDTQFFMDGGATPTQCAMLYASGGQPADFGDTSCTVAGPILCRVNDSAACFSLSNVDKYFIVGTTTTPSDRICLFVPTAASSWLEAAAGCQTVYSTAAFANLEDVNVADVRPQLTAGTSALVNMQKGNWYWGGGAHAQSVYFSLPTNSALCGVLVGGYASTQTVASTNCYTAGSVLCEVHEGPLFYGDAVEYLEKSVRLGGKRFLRG